MNTRYSEDDIQKAIQYLKTHHPDRATRTTAIELLTGMNVAAKDIAQALDDITENEGTTIKPADTN